MFRYMLALPVTRYPSLVSARMFDIGFWELTIIAIVALLVIGPDKLPGVARKAGMWVGRTRRFISQVKNDIDLELRQEELKKALEENAGLDEIKKIMSTDKFSLEEEDVKDYLVKAIPDEDGERTDKHKKTDDTAGEAHAEYSPDPEEELRAMSDDQASGADKTGSTEDTEAPHDREK